MVFRDRPGVLTCPRPVRRRIVHREPIEQRVGVDASEALDDVQVLARTAEARLVGEVRRVDHERVAFPASDRVAHPLAHGCRQMRGVHADDAGVVDHLGENHHVRRRLHDLVEVVVE
jgi:hypothetical protein